MGTLPGRRVTTLLDCRQQHMTRDQIIADLFAHAVDDSTSDADPAAPPPVTPPPTATAQLAGTASPLPVARSRRSRLHERGWSCGLSCPPCSGGPATPARSPGRWRLSQPEPGH